MIFLKSLIVVFLITGYSYSDIVKEKRLAIIYLYSVHFQSCKHGLPRYIKDSLEQAVLSQPDSDIIMASNYAECKKIEDTIDGIDKIIKYDTTLIISNRTIHFKNVSAIMFEANFNGELWITSAQRFFSMEDFMINKGYTEMIHVEADNLLYGKLTDILPILRSGYKGLAAQPLNSNKSFFTASVLWINSVAALVKFNDFLLGLGDKAKWQGLLTSIYVLT
jgi:hypothetical protein